MLCNIPSDRALAKLSAMDPELEAVIRSAREAAHEAERARIYQLAFWPDDERAMPGDFIACALFSASKVTGYLRRTKLASINGLSVIFTGKRLTQVHADVWMGILHLARGKHIGDVVRFRSRQLLELIGRSTHPGQREQLKGWMSELAATQVLVQDDLKHERFGGSLLPVAAEKDADGHTIFALEVNRDLAQLFSSDLWRIDWQIRKALQNKPLALWLQIYFARFHRPVRVEQLHELSGSGSSRKKFRQNLAVALEELAAARGPSAGIDRETDTVVLFKRPSARPRQLFDERQTVMPFARGMLPRG
jgi:hypothetical protein